MIAFSPCKINLGLNVVSRRDDGFHNIETCFFPVPWTDVLEIIPSQTFSMASTGFDIPGKGGDNTCVKAWQLLRRDFNLQPVKIHLHKVIPPGAGLAGGSSNGAHTLLLLNKIFNLGLTEQKLKGYSSELGSDCSFFIHGKPMLGSGRGEILEPINIDLKGRFLVVVIPTIHVSTAEAFSTIQPKKPKRPIAEIIQSEPPERWRQWLVNDFELSIFRKHPYIQGLKESLYKLGATYASMSGSGSAVFGIFEKGIALKKEFEGLTLWHNQL